MTVKRYNRAVDSEGVLIIPMVPSSDYDALLADNERLRALLRDVVGRWQGRIDYYGHQVLDSDVARRIDASLKETAP